jgi:hypothetical protein
VVENPVTKSAVPSGRPIPSAFLNEVNASSFSHRKRMRINEQQIAEYLSLLKALPIRVESQPLWTNVELEALARRWDLAAYDASYEFRLVTNYVQF